MIVGQREFLESGICRCRKRIGMNRKRTAYEQKKGEKRMTLQQMKYFVAAGESGSISEAAKRLYAAQSSVSSAIKEVESQYHVVAFRRESKGVSLTSEGEELMLEFTGILNRLDFLEKKYSEKNYSQCGFSVSAQHHICGLDSLVRLLLELQEENDNYKLGFHECKTVEVLERVEKGMDDLGIIFFAEKSKGQMIQELRNRGILFNHIAYRKAHIYLCDTHPLAQETEIHLEDLKEFPFITYDRRADSNPAYTEMLAHYQNVRKIISVSDRAAAYSLMRACHGFVVGSGYHSLDTQYRDILAIPIYQGENLEIGWIIKNNYQLSELAQKFVNYLFCE